MKVLALPRYGPLGASSRVRFMQYRDLLQASGMTLTIAPLLDDGYLERLYARRPTDWPALLADYLKRMARLVTTGGFDLIWLEKEFFPNLPFCVERLFIPQGMPYVVDYDDAIFHNYDLGGSWKRRVLGTKIERVMQHAAAVVCGNGYLADRATQAGAQVVHRLPTVVDLERYRPQPVVTGAGLVIGWIGSPATVKYLNAVAPVLKQLATETDFTLRVIGANYSLQGVRVDCRRWQEATEVDDIRSIDIGIMPLVDSPWERGKCGYKLIQYMACAKAVVASDVGVNSEIVVEGENGFLATDQLGWLSALRRLAASRALLTSLGASGRKRVEQHYCLQIAAPRLVRIFEEVVATGGQH